MIVFLKYISIVKLLKLPFKITHVMLVTPDSTSRVNVKKTLNTVDQLKTI